MCGHVVNYGFVSYRWKIVSEVPVTPNFEYQKLFSSSMRQKWMVVANIKKVFQGQRNLRRITYTGDSSHTEIIIILLTRDRFWWPDSKMTIYRLSLFVGSEVTVWQLPIYWHLVVQQLKLSHQVKWWKIKKKKCIPSKWRFLCRI